jgi:MoaA/NifB/PqqE/SkfB family radical SAM enzyme
MHNLPKPTAALLQVTRFCNLACAHCSQHAVRPRATTSVADLTTTTWVTILRRLASIGIRRVRFTGGEPFLRRDLEHLCRAATSLGLETSFLTNAQAILPSDIEWLKDLRPKALWVSVYGYPGTLYDRFAGRQGLFSGWARAMERLQAAALPVRLYYPLGEQNAQAVAPFLKESYRLGVREVKLLQVLPHGRALDGARLGPPSPRRLKSALVDAIAATAVSPGLTIKVSVSSGQSSMFRSCGLSIPADRGCHAGLRELWTVDSFGKALACCLLLGKPGPALLDTKSSEDLAGWRRWGSRRTLRRLGIAPGPLGICPALGHDVNLTAQSDFICPLTYTQLPVS